MNADLFLDGLLSNDGEVVGSPLAEYLQTPELDFETLFDQDVFEGDSVEARELLEAHPSLQALFDLIDKKDAQGVGEPMTGPGEVEEEEEDTAKTMEEEEEDEDLKLTADNAMCGAIEEVISDEEQQEVVEPPRGKKRKTRSSISRISEDEPPRGKKRKLYQANPFSDPEKERNRRNAVNAKVNRERKKKEREALAGQMALLRQENGSLRFDNENLRGANESLRKDLKAERMEVQRLKKMVKT